MRRQEGTKLVCVVGRQGKPDQVTRRRWNDAALGRIGFSRVDSLHKEEKRGMERGKT